MHSVVDKIITGFFVLVFGSLWFFSSKYAIAPKQFQIIAYDTFGKEINIGVRSSFQTRDVATSFLQEYQKSHPMFEFGLTESYPDYKRRSSRLLSLFSQR